MKFLPAALAQTLVLCLSASLLSGCESLRNAAGLTKKSPDEFAVTTKAPLVIPPDFNLRPPLPGAPPSNTRDPRPMRKWPCSPMPIPRPWPMA